MAERVERLTAIGRVIAKLQSLGEIADMVRSSFQEVIDTSVEMDMLFSKVCFPRRALAPGFYRLSGELVFKKAAQAILNGKLVRMLR